MASLPKRKRRIDIRIAQAGGQIEVQVADHGDGIPPGYGGRYFPPLRLDQARRHGPWPDHLPLRAGSPQQQPDLLDAAGRWLGVQVSPRVSGTMKPRSATCAESLPRAYIIDDDDALRDALAFLLHSRGVVVTAYASADAFLAAFHHNMRGCILTDIRMGGMSGLDMFDQLEARQCTLPLIVLTGHGNVAMAVGALKKGVRDFVEKPFNTNTLADKVIAAIANDAIATARRDEKSDFATRLAALSERERAK